MKTNSFKSEDVPQDVQISLKEGSELRCPHFHPKKQAICNKLLARGEPPVKPLQFKCPNCGNLTTFQQQ